LVGGGVPPPPPPPTKKIGSAYVMKADKMNAALHIIT